MADGFEIDIDKELAAFEAEERARLGLEDNREQWTDSMIDPFFSAKERPTTTILNGGLTMAHDEFVASALKGIGYNTRSMECADVESLRHGKEFGNKAQCNPTYFTVGNIVKELSRLRDEEGLTAQEIIDNYVFLTAGACGPCRFGMYVTEYRKALRDAGFDGFRVVLFQQQSGFKQATGEEIGLVLNPQFFMALARGLFAGDVLNVLSYRMRPYEVEEGATDRAIAEVKREVHEALQQNNSVLRALWRGRKFLEAVELDRLRAKPKVAIIGEFWAMTTEGDGNYHLQRFVESEGGENDIQTLVNWLLYTLWEMRHDTERRMTLRGTDESYYGLEGSDVGYKMAGVWLGELALRATFATFSAVAGLKRNRLPDMDEIAKVGHSFYNNELRGGEGHMEVGRNRQGRPQLLQQRAAWRRRSHGGRQARPQRGQAKSEHDPERQAVRMHAELRRFRRNSNRHHRASSGCDLLPGRNQWRRRGELLLARADVHVQGARARSPGAPGRARPVRHHR
jgi:predicted nucleotide-binding protein (sugar kinase/HSP70/actin superfamily)